MTTKTTHTYKGRTIKPAVSCSMIEAGYKWYVDATHPTGLTYSAELCRHYYSLAEARSAIREAAAHQEAMDAEARS